LRHTERFGSQRPWQIVHNGSAFAFCPVHQAWPVRLRREPHCAPFYQAIRSTNSQSSELLEETRGKSRIHIKTHASGDALLGLPCDIRPGSAFTIPKDLSFSAMISTTTFLEESPFLSEWEKSPTKGEFTKWILISLISIAACARSAPVTSQGRGFTGMVMRKVVPSFTLLLNSIVPLWSCTCW